ncbi:hypothetical protein HanRHA438_Chr05g0223881 [Helianthus annuus]|uniref:Uncharacterized protein n=1 Tax=Helianthus annuus TaxID=4232 RepID=A0A9K3NN36_HELAN|nr:hypothetical protein HanXRQr2_Chr05g0214611 [Helianthus annuus]KAJ0918954.1 hypothetical protein HanRHA438_Chr05g0223881 [Helianthus annuus]
MCHVIIATSNRRTRHHLPRHIPRQRHHQQRPNHRGRQKQHRHATVAPAGQVGVTLDGGYDR